MKAALLPQSCCQTCPMFRRQQLTLFSSYSFYMQRQQGQRKSPVCPTSSARGLFAVYSHHQFFLTGIYFAALAVLISSRCRKAIRAGHPVPSSAPGSLWVTFQDGVGEAWPQWQCWGCLCSPSVPQFITLLPTPVCIFKNSVSQAWVKVLKCEEPALNSGCILRRKVPNFCVCEISSNDL